MRSSSCNSSSRPLFTRSSTSFGLSVRIIFASIRCLTVWRARYPTYSREKIIDLLWNIAHGPVHITPEDREGITGSVLATGSALPLPCYPMRTVRRIEAPLSQHQPLHRTPMHQMFGHNLVHISR